MDNKNLVERIAYQFKFLVSSGRSKEAIIALGKWIESSPWITEEDAKNLLTLVSSK